MARARSASSSLEFLRNCPSSARRSAANVSSHCSPSALSCFNSRSSLLFASLATLSRVDASVYDASSLVNLTAAISSSLDFFANSFSSAISSFFATLASSLSSLSARSRSASNSASLALPELFKLCTCARKDFESFSAATADAFNASTCAARDSYDTRSFASKRSSSFENDAPF